MRRTWKEKKRKSVRAKQKVGCESSIKVQKEKKTTQPGISNEYMCNDI